MEIVSWFDVENAIGKTAADKLLAVVGEGYLKTPGFAPDKTLDLGVLVDEGHSLQEVCLLTGISPQVVLSKTGAKFPGRQVRYDPWLVYTRIEGLLVAHQGEVFTTREIAKRLGVTLGAVQRALRKYCESEQHSIRILPSRRYCWGKE